MVAMIFPPMAGRVWRRSPLPSSMESSVQSAVSPVPSFAARYGIRVLPVVVAAPRMTSGFLAQASSKSASAHNSQMKSSKLGLSTITHR